MTYTPNLFVNSASFIGINALFLVANVDPIVSSAVMQTSNTVSSLSAEINWIGVQLPQWIGWVFYFLGLIFGATLSTYQETAVDKYIKSPRLKPYYSFGFGVFFTLFGIPLYYSNINVWQLVLPAVLSTAIGSQIIYYFISSTKYIRDAIFIKFGIEPPTADDSPLSKTDKE